MSKSKKGQDLARIMRPENTRFSLALLITAAICNNLPIPQILALCLLLIACYGLVTSYNDLHDRAIDTANQRNLPLVDGSLTPRDVKNLIIILALTVFVFQLFLPQPHTIITTFVYASLGWAYSAPLLKIENRGLFAIALLATCYTTLPIIWGYGWPDARLWPVIIGAFFLSASTLLYKDFKDQTGDRKGGKLTPFIRYGPKVTKTLSVFFSIVGLVTISVYFFNPLTFVISLLSLVAIMLLALKTAPSLKILLTVRLLHLAIVIASILMIMA